MLHRVMRLNIFPKLFIATLVSMLLMVIVMALFINISFRSGFSDYLHKGEINKVKELAFILGNEYGNRGSWDFIRKNPRQWNRLIRQVRGLPPPRRRPPRRFPREHDFFDGRRPPPPFERGNNRPPPRFGQEMFRPPPRDERDERPPPSGLNRPRNPPPEALGDRISLLDVDKQIVIGRKYVPKPKSFLTHIEVEHNGSIVGWVAVKQGTLIIDGLAEKFLAQQFRNFYLIAALALLIAILSSVLLARNFVRPIKELSTGTKKLTKGNFDSHINVTSKDELGQLATNFNKLALTLGKNEIQRKQWLVDISHELRTPISILRSEIEAMLDGIRKPNNERIRSLHTDVLSLGKLVDDLYQLSLSDSEETPSQNNLVDLVGIVTKAVSSVKSLLQEKSIELKFSETENPIMIYGNERSLHQLLSNLLANSSRYTHEKGSVEIKIECIDEVVEVIIQDTAPAVPNASLPFLFDRLYRVDKSRNRAFGGSGLGLSICATIVAAHDGTIKAEHSPLGGLLIRIQFPCANDSQKKIEI